SLKSKWETMPTTLPRRHVAIAPILHQPQRFDRRLAGRHCVGVGCHDLSQLRPSRAFALCQHAVNGITSREDAQQAVIAVGHKDGADASVTHRSAGGSYRGTRGKRDRVLVSDDVQQVSHYQALCWRSAFWRVASWRHLRWSLLFRLEILKFYLDQDGTN